MREEKEIRKEEKFYCEKYREWVLVDLGCKHPKEYCQFRKQCLLNFKAKFREES